METYSLSRADIRAATGIGYLRARNLIEKPYRLHSQSDPATQLGGGQTERFLLGDILARMSMHVGLDEKSAQNLIAADAAFRKGD